MFDSIVDGHRHVSRRDIAPMLISWAVHTAVTGAVVLLPLLFATNHLPAVASDVLTYVTVASPPPPAASAPKPVVKHSLRAAPMPRTAAAPLDVGRELPLTIETADDDEGASEFDSIGGVAGGVPRGVPGGVIGGVLGGIPDVPLPPPPASPTPAPRPPVRTGGQIQAPALVKRVPPVYPPIAAKANLQGVVIVEATVGRDGRVEDVTVLRSVPLLDAAAVEAVRQWVYAPLLLNGEAERFVLTVTVSFALS